MRRKHLAEQDVGTTGRARRWALWGLAFWVALGIVPASIVWARINDRSVIYGVWLGLGRIGIYALIVAGALLWDRYGNSPGKGKFPEVEHGVKRWKQR